MIEVLYASHLTPPAPILTISIQTLGGGPKIETSALVDADADATIVSLPLLREISAQPSFSSTLRSPWGEARNVLLYLIDIRIGAILLPGLYAVGDALGKEVILGRDALNRLEWLLDGPA